MYSYYQPGTEIPGPYIQAPRLDGTGLYANSQRENILLRQFCELDRKSRSLLEVAMEPLGLSALTYTHEIKLARTIADMDNVDHIAPHNINKSIG
jgi:magnesium chelatase family protein